ncbi:unnamed protein product, partial [marine sediment metagenome]
MEKEKIGILRVNPKLRDESKTTAKNNNMTLSVFTEKALRELIDNIGYNYDLLMNLVNDTPSLSLYAEIIAEELKGAPRDLIKDIIIMIEKDNVTFCKVTLKESEENKIKTNDRA